MNATEAHIVFDSFLREINKEIELNIIPEQKDLFINAESDNFILKASAQERDRIRNLKTYANIGQYYRSLAPFIVELDLPVIDNGDRYSYAELPTKTTSLINKDLFRNKATYVISNESINFDFSNITSDISNSEVYIGSVFTVNISNLVFNGTYNVNTSTKIIKGNIYKIIRSTGFDFTKYGATSNIEGTIFTCTESYSFSNGGTSGRTNKNINIELEVYAAKPLSFGSPKLKATPIESDDYVEPLQISVLVDCKPPFKKGSLTKGKKYVIHTIGDTDFSSFGLNTQIKYSTFVSTKSGEPNWGNSPTTLQEVDYVGSELIKPVDREDKLKHAFGSAVSRPISEIINNAIRIYHMGNFKVVKVLLTYIRVPNRVNYKANNELEFNPVEQIGIIKDAAILAASSLSSDNYSSLKNEDKNQ